MNVYKEILKGNLPRLLNLYNEDPFSQTRGYGDRIFWGWKVSDFSNGTVQGGVHSLAVALKLGLIQEKPFVLDIIDSAIRAVATICSKNGSLVEAYPYENSFCVASLVAFDILRTVQLLDTDIHAERKKEYLEIVSPLLQFLQCTDESHGIISNHLATAAAAFQLWEKIIGEQQQRSKELLDVIYKHQSEEGWYMEYEGPDPGYQTLCTWYLYSILENTGEEQLKESLEKSVKFLKYFVHPDNTIGGLYGSRNTEVYYPAGIVGLASFLDDAAVISAKLHQGIEQGMHIEPGHVDANNYIPLLNAYSEAALLYEQNQGAIENAKATISYADIFEKKFEDAGVFIQSTSKYYAIINYKKGGTIKVFDKQAGQIDIEDGGIFGELKSGAKFSSQVNDESIPFENNSLETDFYKVNEPYPTPFRFIVLRLLALTVLRISFLGQLFKKVVVKMLMTGKKKIGGGAKRMFEFQDEKIIVTENIQKPKGCKRIGHFGKCKAIHMASSGYYHKQVEQLMKPSKFVQFK